MKRCWWIAALVLAADRITKLLAEQMTGPMEVLPGIFRLRLAHNTGMAFSFLSGNALLLAAVTALVLGAAFLLLRRFRLGSWSRVSGMLMLGGALGNLLDRVIYGQVTDMVEITLFRFAVFNLADVAVCLGCLGMILSLLLRPQEWETKNG